MLSVADGPAITAAFGLGDLPRMTGPVARGELGLVWRLRTSRGTWAVKEPMPDVTVGDVDLAAQFQEASRVAGVPAPQVIRTTAGPVAAAIGSTMVRVLSWVDVAPADPMLDPAEVGAMLARLHAVPFGGPGAAHPWNCDPVGVPAWRALSAALTRAGAPFAPAFDHAVGELLAVEARFERPGAARFCHCDLWADNVRASGGGGLLVLDWDNAGLADPDHELAMVLFEYARHRPERAQALVVGYVAEGGGGRLRGPGSFTMAFAQLGHIAEFQGRRWLAAADGSPERSRAAASMDEYLGDPLTCAVADELLDAVT